jgi:hypothetical protein
MTTKLALTTGSLGMGIGYAGLMAGVMAFDAGQDTKPSMALLGVSSLSIIPITIIATSMTIITQNPLYQTLYIVPIAGIATAFAIDSKST